MTKLKAPSKKTLILLSALFVGYNLILFVLTSFSGHHLSYWCSYAFMMIALVFFAFDLSLANVRTAKDYLLGFPVIRHAVLYLGTEFIASVVFMALDKKEFSGKIAFAVQTVFLILHIIFDVLCLTAKEKVEEVQQKTKASTGFMKNLNADAEMLVMYAYDDELKKAFSKFAEAVKYSDKVSSPALEDVENRLSLLTANSKQMLRDKDKDVALKCCEEMMLTLEERNKKCKAFK